MAKIRFLLNNRKLQNYAFYEPMSNLHITKANPIAAIEEGLFNENIVKALRNGTIIDIDGNVDIEKGQLAEAAESPKEEKPVEATKEEKPVEKKTSSTTKKKSTADSSKKDE